MFLQVEVRRADTVELFRFPSPVFLHFPDTDASSDETEGGLDDAEALSDEPCPFPFEPPLLLELAPPRRGGGFVS